MNYTTVEQSKKLLELGINPETADMLWEQHTFEGPYVTVKPWTTKGKSIGAHIIPCWSAGALLELIPKKYSLDWYEDGALRIYSGTYGYDNGIMDAKTILEAAFKMVVWLLENGYIKKGD